MNYSTVILLVVAAYLWHANSLHNEIAVIKKLLVVIYESVEAKFNNISQEMSTFHTSVMTTMTRLHNMTRHSIDLILVNSRKIDDINGKIDTLLAH
uniref:Gp16 n=1 Tax=Mamestra configurata nucleopolyhedrovirus TaxID=207830 RepID=A0A7G7Y7Y9_NPVMC|nr:gp16 [Mamestra configurata nucleopolyhedrovirus A]